MTVIPNVEIAWSGDVTLDPRTIPEGNWEPGTYPEGPRGIGEFWSAFQSDCWVVRIRVWGLEVDRSGPGSVERRVPRDLVELGIVSNRTLRNRPEEALRAVSAATERLARTIEAGEYRFDLAPAPV